MSDQPLNDEVSQTEKAGAVSMRPALSCCWDGRLGHTSIFSRLVFRTPSESEALPEGVEVRACLQPVFPSYVRMGIAVATWRVLLRTAENPDTDDTSVDDTEQTYNVSSTGPWWSGGREL